MDFFELSLFDGLNPLIGIILVTLAFLAKRDINILSLIIILITVKVADLTFTPSASSFPKDYQWLFYIVLFLQDLAVVLLIHKRRFLVKTTLKIIAAGTSFKYRAWRQEHSLITLYLLSCLISLLTALDDWGYLKYTVDIA